MRGFLDFLCETLGAWEETLELARLGEDPSFPAPLAHQPGYYPMTVARCLKHLGRSGESRDKYREGLKKIAEFRDPETALYVNNFLTLLVWRGELRNADALAELNVRALSWIREPWRFHWQVEHGFSSIAYLKMLQGRLAAADALFGAADRAWDTYAGDRPWIYDYYPFYRSELILLADPSAHEEALSGLTALLDIAVAERWPESVCRGQVQSALVHLDRARRLDERSDVIRASDLLDEAAQLRPGMTVVDVAIAYNLARLKLELARHDTLGAAFDEARFGALIERVSRLITGSGLALSAPEVVAARGASSYLGGSRASAHAAYVEAVAMCRRQDNLLALASPRSLVRWLGDQLGAVTPVEPAGSPLDLLGLVGSDLTPEWMGEQLELVVG